MPRVWHEGGEERVERSLPLFLLGLPSVPKVQIKVLIYRCSEEGMPLVRRTVPGAGRHSTTAASFDLALNVLSWVVLHLGH
jgi:hypothetical protein